MSYVQQLLGSSSFLPHGYCFTWSPGLLWSMVIADAVIAASYFSIPIAILAFTRRRPESTLNGVALMFSAFIFACGITHVMDIWTIWQPDYAVQAATKVVTAIVSVATAVLIWMLMPKALSIPTAARLKIAISNLEGEMARRRTTEEQLNEFNESLSITLASIGAGFISLNRQGKVVRMNAMAESLTGWLESEAQGRMVWQVLDRVGRAAELLSENPIDAMIEREITINDSHLIAIRSRQGIGATVDLRSALTRTADGEIIGCAMVMRNMTEILQNEVESQRLAAIVENSNDAIISKTLDGLITTWNNAAQNMFGYTQAEAIGQTIQLLIPEQHRVEEARVVAAMESGGTVAPYETVRRTKDGRLIDVSITVSPIRDTQGRIVGASKIVRDITERKAAEYARRITRELRSENEQLQEANRLKSQFLANMSHELRTPLNAIIGFSDLLHSGAVQPDSPKHHEFLGHISSSGRHLLSLINDILDLAKVESGKVEFSRRAVNLTALVGDVIQVLQPSALAKQITLNAEIDPTLGDLFIDPARMNQVLFNYLSNAIKFTPDLGRVTVRALAEGAEKFRIEVEDTGTGISERDLDRLFVEFQQLDSSYSKRHEGTGLGLALTKRLVEAQGGQVGVKSVVGKGSVFFIVMDRIHREVDQPVGTPHILFDGIKVNNGATRYLVIDDCPQPISDLSNGLADEGTQVDIAQTARVATERTSEYLYDAMTLNLQLRERPGLEVLAEIRGNELNRSTPVVGITMPGIGDAVVAFSIADILRKPIRLDEIVVAMARFKRNSYRQPRVLVIDDDRLALDLMRTTLENLSYDVRCEQDARRALSQLDQLQPDCIILDLIMPDFDGVATLAALQQMATWKHIPVLIWTSMLLTDEEYAALTRSVATVINKRGDASAQMTLAPMIEQLRQRRHQTANTTDAAPATKGSA